MREVHHDNAVSCVARAAEFIIHINFVLPCLLFHGDAFLSVRDFGHAEKWA